MLETPKIDREKIVNQIKTEYSFATLTSEHEAPAIDIFIRAFCDSEPTTKFLGIQYSEYEPFAQEVIQKAIREGLSKVAIDKNGKVVACAVAEDLASPLVPNFVRYPRLKPIFDFLDELSSPFVSGKQFFPGKILHLWIAAVDDGVRGQGLSTEIDMTCIQSAAQHGYQFAYAEFTNDISAKVTKHFKVLSLCNKLKFNDFRVGGRPPFEGLPGKASSYVAGIGLGVTLEDLSSCYEAEVSNTAS
jgi:hypothetical protein